jgi:hypothetical protein
VIVLKHIGLALSVIFLLVVIVSIARQCYLDSRDDFKMVFDDVKSMFKKKKAD